jgi:ribA/ribD-fused uncharacterized protein
MANELPARSHMERVAFYGPEMPNFELANFYPSPISVDGLIWPTVEHYYQAQKTNDVDWRERIRTAASPGESKQLGRSIPDYDDEKWQSIKEDVMMRASRAKFDQHESLRVYLLATAGKYIVEDTPDDDYWGEIDGKGRNRMGYILMALRDELLDLSGMKAPGYN